MPILWMVYLPHPSQYYRNYECLIFFLIVSPKGDWQTKNETQVWLHIPAQGQYGYDTTCQGATMISADTYMWKSQVQDISASSDYNGFSLQIDLQTAGYECQKTHVQTPAESISISVTYIRYICDLLVCGGCVVEGVVSDLDLVVHGYRTLRLGLAQEILSDDDQRDPRTPHVLLGAREDHPKLWTTDDIFQCEKYQQTCLMSVYSTGACIEDV